MQHIITKQNIVQQKPEVVKLSNKTVDELEKELMDNLKKDPLIIIQCGSEHVVTTHSIYHKVIEEQLRKGKDVKAPNGDWYEHERNYDLDSFRRKPGYHILKYPQGKTPYENIGKDIDFYKKIPEIWKLTTPGERKI